jgi:Fe-S cluster biogenesis protein NfuA
LFFLQLRCICYIFAGTAAGQGGFSRFRKTSWRGFVTFTAETGGFFRLHTINGFFMIRTGNPVISIYTEMTPNPETMKFVANKLLYPGKSIDFPDTEAAKPSPLAIELFGFPFIKAVFIASNFVTLTKTPDTDWDDVIPSIRQFLKEYLEENKPVINEEEIVLVKSEGNIIDADDDDVVKRIKELLENYVKPAVEMDGGAIQFKSYNEGTVNLMLQGSCSGCPSSMITLKAGIEGMMKRMIPEVKEVVAEAE